MYYQYVFGEVVVQGCEEIPHLCPYASRSSLPIWNQILMYVSVQVDWMDIDMIRLEPIIKLYLVNRPLSVCSKKMERVAGVAMYIFLKHYGLLVKEILVDGWCSSTSMESLVSSMNTLSLIGKRCKCVNTVIIDQMPCEHISRNVYAILLNMCSRDCLKLLYVRQDPFLNLKKILHMRNSPLQRPPSALSNTKMRKLLSVLKILNTSGKNQ